MSDQDREFRNSARAHLSPDTFRSIENEARDTAMWHRECDRADDRRFEEYIKERDSGREDD